MSNFIGINSYCAVKNNTVVVNDSMLYAKPDAGFSIFIEQAYKHFNINYPKFYKMDSLSKLGFLTAELLLKDNFKRDNYPDYKIGIVLSNSHSSLDVDAKYFNQVQNNIASPALFVYTLPNIVIGEICIRHKIKGENNFFVSDAFDAPFITGYIKDLIQSDVMNACITGWVDVLNENFEALLMLVERKNERLQNPDNESGIFNTENVLNLFQKNKISCKN